MQALSFEHQTQSKRKGRKTHVVKRAVGADGAALIEIVLLRHDGGDAARGEARGAAADELGERAEELALGECGLQGEEVREDADDHEEFVCDVAVGAGVSMHATMNGEWRAAIANAMVTGKGWKDRPLHE